MSIESAIFKMNVLFVPSIGLDASLIERLAASIDYPIKYKCVLNNGPTGALEDFRNEHQDWIVREPICGNRGVAGSWNDCAKMFPNEPSWLIMNEDAYFLPGYLEKICSAADHNKDAPIIYLNDSHAYYCFVLTAAGLKKLGTFDENFWPAYYEDCDYRVRMKLDGVKDHVYALQGLPPLPHGKPRSGGTDYSSLIQASGLLTRAYWRRKWGSDNHEEATYQTPYKDHRLGVHEWVYDPAHRAEIYPLWRTFMERPSLYD